MSKNIITPENTEVAKALINLYAQYVEGFNDGAMVAYNSLLQTVSLRTMEEVVRITPFEYHSLQLTSVVGDLFSFRAELWEKIESDLAKAKKMKEEINSKTYDKFAVKVIELCERYNNSKQ